MTTTTERTRSRLEAHLDTEMTRRHGVTLEDWLVAGRKDGRSWRVLAAQIKTLTGYPVSHHTLRLWYWPAVTK